MSRTRLIGVGLVSCFSRKDNAQFVLYIFHLILTTGRVLELKNEMVNLEFSEFHYFDDVLSDLKLTPVSCPQ